MHTHRVVSVAAGCCFLALVYMYDHPIDSNSATSHAHTQGQKPGRVSGLNTGMEAEDTEEEEEGGGGAFEDDDDTGETGSWLYKAALEEKMVVVHGLPRSVSLRCFISARTRLRIYSPFF